MTGCVGLTAYFRKLFCFVGIPAEFGFYFGGEVDLAMVMRLF